MRVLHLHHGDSGVDFWRQRNVDLIFVPVDPKGRGGTGNFSGHVPTEIPFFFLVTCDTWRRPGGSSPDSHALLDVGWSHLVTQVHHELGKLFHVDDVFGILGVCVDDLRASI